MGIQDVLEDETLADNDDLTVGELKEFFGEEVVRRGIQYMNSLREADHNFRQSANPEQMEEGYKKIANSEEISERAQEGAEEWSSKMEEGGLGLEDG